MQASTHLRRVSILIGVNAHPQIRAEHLTNCRGCAAMTMTIDVLLLAGAAVSTVVILFGVVILGDIQDHASQRRPARH
jgi:hypothetical protein